MARVEGLRVYPVKGLDGVDIEAATVGAGGTLAGDREFALVDGDSVINAKQAPSLHEVDADFDPETGELSVEAPGRDSRTFALRDDRTAASAWFSEHVGADLSLERDAERGFVDRPEIGPSVVSTATLEAVASWFDDLTTAGVRRRLRANVEVGGVEAFWEDRFLGDDAPAFEAGGVRVDGVKPCGRCVVPTRDPDTGDPLPGFRERFVERRRETLPEWVDRDAFDHFYVVMLLASVPEADRGKTIRVGDDVTVVESARR
ncbi:MOSC domain-containing protein [Halobacterium litoreum]|uniref:MOSC domain-containing protein n=1 Tax=Halobacterium litoreum TaxID=2039234 RepID=A0ABD5NDF6_9EURY|nr:MOSC N-terminal beta barrel domain-containing protein [Halobacterium litoreum]UHH13946.1 MOSC N-terminal beta barrel domain-containing protein [Halobacterium litoreum]